jgi:hypothetical protein
MATYPPIIVDNIPELQNAVWHVGVDPAPEVHCAFDPDFDSSGSVVFSNSNRTATAVMS